MIVIQQRDTVVFITASSASGINTAVIRSIILKMPDRWLHLGGLFRQVSLGRISHFIILIYGKALIKRMTSLYTNVSNSPRIEIDLAKIYRNTKRLKDMFLAKGISVMGVTKGVLGSPPVATAMTAAGVQFIADSRIENIQKIQEADIKNTFVLIRTPPMSKIKQVVKYADISLNSELDVIQQLSEEARAQNKIHGIILMVDLGDLREGILPEDMEQTLDAISTFKGVKTFGIGTNLGCVGAILPDQKKMDELSGIAVTLENRFGLHLDLISGGSSANYQWVTKTDRLGRINNLRIGEMIFTGRNTLDYAPVEHLEKNTVCLVAEVIEIKQKDSLPHGTVSTDAFGNVPVFSDRGTIRRAIIGIGRQDVLIQGLSPIGKMEIIGSSSDHVVIDLKEDTVRVGDQIRFHLTYGAQLSAMTSPYIEKIYLNESKCG
jgi:predicted amino acid racemase